MVDERVANSFIGREIKAMVASVPDGDGLNVDLPGGKRGIVRFYGVDAPELAQPYGRDALKKLRSIADKNVLLDVIDVDQYGRMVCVVNNDKLLFRQDESLNIQMVRSGLAYPFTRFGTLDGSYEALQEAREHKRGVWASKSPLEAPWEYRARTMSDEQPDTQNPPFLALYLFLARVVLYALMLGGLGYVGYAILKYIGFL
jgi:endonuclease YncB( thermonuclease family)